MNEKYEDVAVRAPSALFRSHCNATCLIDHRGGGGGGGGDTVEDSKRQIYIGKPTARQHRKISPTPRHHTVRVVVPLSDRM